MRQLRIGMAQINVTVGDIAGNQKKILDTIIEARSFGVDLLTFPELVICGYPPEDLLFKNHFIKKNLKALNNIINNSQGMAVMLGFVDAADDLYNAAAVISDGKLAGVYHKIFLPNYGVFDEYRYFRPGYNAPVYIINGVGVGINICEDIWYETGPATEQAYSGAEVIVNISASPYHYGKGKEREAMLSARASDNIAIICYNNLVGGQDELVFDGNSIILDEKGKLIARGRQFAEDLIIADLDVEAVSRARRQEPRRGRQAPPEEQRYNSVKIAVSEKSPAMPKLELELRSLDAKGFSEEMYDALVLGMRDYVRKNGFGKVLIGISGGIDSAIVAAIAVDALGSSDVVGVAMPSRYSSEGSVSDAVLLAENLGIELLNIPIEEAFQAYTDMLTDAFKKSAPGVAEENIQARIRGNILMALSNKFGWMVLTTGNKSEMAVGYTTLYGDMAGGFAVIKDVPKTVVYELARYRNSRGEVGVIPNGIIDKPPSAELRPEQKDVDTLPPYEQLDPVLTAYVEEDRSVEQIIDMGFAKEMVQRIAQLVDKSEYKRRQAPPGIKITPRAFGRDRRLPITNAFKEW